MMSISTLAKSFKKALGAVFFISLSVLFIASCVTDPQNTNLNFVGTYKGANSCNPTDTISYVITGSTGNNSLAYLPIYPGNTPGCVNSTTLPVVVSGHNITAITQNIYDDCHNLFSYTATGTLVGNILSVTVTTVSEGNYTTVCTFTGTKQ